MVEANAGIHSLAMAVAVRALIPLPVKLYTDQLRNSPFQAGGSMVSPVLTSALVAGTEKGTFLIISCQIQYIPSGSWTPRKTILMDT